MKHLFVVLLSIFAIANIHAATAKVKRTWIEHGVTRDDQKGMTVHTNFTIAGHKGKWGDIILFLKDANGNYVKAQDGSLSTNDGSVYFSGSFMPSYDKSEFYDYEIFVPYSELHLPEGTHGYTITAYINDKNSYIAHGEPVSFNATGNTRKQNTAPRQNRNNNYGNSRNNSSNNAISNYNKESSGRITWRQNYPNGGYCDYVLNPDGSGSAISKIPCTWCHGTKVCSICQGRGGTYGRAYGGMWYPCVSCAGSGMCQNCRGEGYTILTMQINNGVAIGYDQKGNIYTGGGGSGSGSSSGSSRHSSGSRSSRSKDYVDVIEYAPDYTGDNNRYCKQCDRIGPAHVHIRKRY